MGHGVGFNLFRSPKNGHFGEIRHSGREMYNRKVKAKSEKSAKNSLTHLRLCVSEIRQDYGDFLLGEVGSRHLTYRSERLGNHLPVPKKTGRGIPVSVLEARGDTFRTLVGI